MAVSLNIIIYILGQNKMMERVTRFLTDIQSSVYTLNIIASCDLSIMVHVHFTALFEGDLTKIDMHLKNV